MPRAGVVLDRDGTIVDFVRDDELGVIESAFHPDQLRFLPGAVEGLRLLAAAGLPLAIATNQSGAAKDRYPEAAIHRTNAALVDRLAAEGIAIARVAVCVHDRDAACSCRKPAPGMLLDLAAALDLDPASSFMVGDSAADVEAARRANMRAALLSDPGRCEICPLKGTTLSADLAAPRLDELARLVLATI